MSDIQGWCQWCEEPVHDHDEQAEWYEKANPDKHYWGHASCSWENREESELA